MYYIVRQQDNFPRPRDPPFRCNSNNESHRKRPPCNSSTKKANEFTQIKDIKKRKSLTKEAPKGLWKNQSCS